MKKTLRFLLALVVAFAVMLMVRAVGLTIYTIDGPGLEPVFEAGDRVLVNRWSYGLRIGGSSGIFDYGRIGRQPVRRGDLVAFETPADSTGNHILLCRCVGLPGDSITVDGHPVIVPSIANCASADYYWMESVNPDNAADSRSLGFIAEELIIGRAVAVVYNHHPERPLWNGWRSDRFLLPK